MLKNLELRLLPAGFLCGINNPVGVCTPEGCLTPDSLFLLLIKGIGIYPLKNADIEFVTFSICSPVRS